MTDLALTLHTETAADSAAIEKLHERAFGRAALPARLSPARRPRAPLRVLLCGAGWHPDRRIGAPHSHQHRGKTGPAAWPLTVDPPSRGAASARRWSRRRWALPAPAAMPSRCWLVTSPITSGSAFAVRLPANGGCPGRSIRHGCFSSRSWKQRSRALRAMSPSG